MMTEEQVDRLQRLAKLAGVVFFDYQLRTFQHVLDVAEFERRRLCLYYRTGAGKTLTALVAMNLWGQNNVLVIAPPSTHDTWTEVAKSLGMGIDVMSHAKFRQKNTKLSRNQAVIADEMHLFGGHSGKGWKKLDGLARGLKAPIILASATPNYNDADRVYCIQHVLDPHSVKGGFLEFLYAHCVTEQNPFGVMPNVLGFQRYKNAAEYLEDLPDVMYLPDNLSYNIDDYPIAEKIPPEMEEFGLNRRRDRMIASIIEEKHARIFHSLLDIDGFVTKDVFDYVRDWVETAVSSVLIYCNHSTVAEGLSQSFDLLGLKHALVTGRTTQGEKQKIIQQFRDEEIEVLIGTATLATGTDGLDKVCDWLIIVDDTEDDSLRRQLIGRIMPRGSATSTAQKVVKRLVLQ